MFLNDQKRNVYIFSDRLEYLSIIRRALFDKLQQSPDMLDENIIKFMESKPNYKDYVTNLNTEIITKWNSECKIWQEKLSVASSEEFYHDDLQEIPTLKIPN